MLPIAHKSRRSLTEYQTNIAKIWRGYQIRQHFLPSSTYREAIVFLNHCPKIEALPKAPSGTAPVYFPPSLPVILKNTGFPKNKSRWHIMFTIRHLCKKNRFINLKIPLATPYRTWLIEEKLSVTEFKQKGQVGLYCENREKFSDAATQMTKLLCKLIYPDILTSIHPYQEELDIKLARYDNLMLFLEDGIGKIGLVDLEDVRLRETCMSQSELFEIALNALQLFPYHAREICSALHEEFPEITLDINAVQHHSAQIVKRFNKIYHDHSESVFHLKPQHLPPSSQTLDFTDPVVDQIMEKMIAQLEICIQSIVHAGSMIDQLQSRTFSIPVHTVLSDYLSYEKTLREVLTALVHLRTISYANIYLNHAKKPMIRIHY